MMAASRAVSGNQRQARPAQGFSAAGLGRQAAVAEQHGRRFDPFATLLARHGRDRLELEIGRRGVPAGIGGFGLFQGLEQQAH
jgi:hypothetical protein